MVKRLGFQVLRVQIAEGDRLVFRLPSAAWDTTSRLRTMVVGFGHDQRSEMVMCLCLLLASVCPPLA